MPSHLVFALIIVILFDSAPQIFEVCTAVLLKTRVYWDVTLCTLWRASFLIAYCYFVSLSCDHILSQ
jgi:hypothetical protein